MSLLAFYRETGLDQSGRRFEDILRRDNAWLESTHDYIQWLFPLDTASGANPLAPVLTPEDIRAFNEDPALREGLLRAYSLMLAFYGFKREQPPHPPLITRAADFDERAKVWLRPYNHNFLRITRILRSLTLLGLRIEAQSFFAALIVLYRQHENVIGSDTFRFWKNALD